MRFFIQDGQRRFSLLKKANFSTCTSKVVLPWHQMEQVTQRDVLYAFSVLLVHKKSSVDAMWIRVRYETRLDTGLFVVSQGDRKTQGRQPKQVESIAPDDAF